jgi:hypothetical protein
MGDELLVPDLPRGSGRSTDGELDVGEEGFRTDDCNLAITTPRLCWLLTHGHMSWPRQEGLSLQVQLTTQARIGNNVTKLADECISSEMWGFTKLQAAKLFLTD